MEKSRLARILFFTSLFLVVVFWGYFPSIWIMAAPKWILAASAIASAIAWFVFSLPRLQLWIKQRSTQFGIGLAITALFLLLGLGTINWLAIEFNQKKDITKNKLHSLSEQTSNILKGLKEDITIRVWTTNMQRMGANIDMNRFFENYKIAGHGKVKIEIKNPNELRNEAEQDQVRKDHLVIVRAASGRESRVDNFSEGKGEEMITNAISQVLKGSKKSICFLTGHGQFSISETGPNGISQIKDSLEASTYSTQEVNLISDASVPSTCQVLVSVGPTSDPIGEELNKIHTYFEGGGKVVLLLGASAPQGWKNVASKYGVKVRKDIVLDPRVQPPFVAATRNYAKDVDIVSSFRDMSGFIEASSIDAPNKETPELRVKTFVSSESWTYSKAGSLKEIKGGLNKLPSDVAGPHTLGVLISKPMPGSEKKEEAKGDDAVEEKSKGEEAQMVIYASSQLIMNAFSGRLGNADLFLNTINFLAADKDLIGIRPKELNAAKLELSEERLRAVLATVLMVAGLFILGAFVAYGRRHHSTAV